MAAQQASQVSSLLTSKDLPKPSTTWLTNLITTQRVNQPLPALAATAKHRLLALDLTTPSLLSPTNPGFPPNISDSAKVEVKVTGNICVQVLSVEDISKSRWSQVEEIEAFERGETTKGREIIRVVPPDERDAGAGTQGQGQDGLPEHGSGGTHKLLLQDVKGQTVYALELRKVDKVGLGMGIGCKLMLKGPTVARGMVLLEPRTCVVLGGKVEVLHKAWLEGRKRELIDAAKEHTRE